jgi:pimeloyl-ACP methyl ester carboxylesterase
MRRIFSTLMMLVLLLLVRVQPVSGQAAAGISVLGRDGQARTEITDGDGIQLRAILPAKATVTTSVEFFISGFDSAVAACTVNAGADACLSEVFPALGWYWLPEHRLIAEVRGQPLPGEVVLEIAPRPVVMVHGFISSWETWKSYLGADGYLAGIGLQGFAVGDGQVPGVLNTGSPSNPEGKTNSIAQNAAILKGYIAAVQQQTGAEQVDLLVHSMGGMITRYYLDRVMETDNVAQVIFLGTPHSGSSCVFPVAALGYLLPASIEIQPAYMDGVFNQQVVRRQGVPFHMVAGTRLLEPVASPCTNVPSDTVVGFDSATSIPLNSIQRIPLIHGDLTVNRTVFETAVRVLLQAGPEAFAPYPDPAAPAIQSAPEQFSRTFTGHIGPGESHEITIQIDPNVTLANFSMFDNTRSLQIEVRGASGNVIALDAQKNGILEVDDPETMIYLGYGFADPKPGAWVVKVMSTDQTPAAGADFALMARYIGGATLSAQASPTIPAPGEAVNIFARLTADGQSAEVDLARALLRKPDGSTEQVSLTPGKDGLSVAYTPDQAGLYAVELTVTGKTAQGNLIDRAAFLSFEVQPGADAAAQTRNTLFASLGVGGLLVGLLCLGTLALTGGVVLIRMLRKK